MKWKLLLLSAFLLSACQSNDSEKLSSSNYTNPLFTKNYKFSYPNDSAFTEFIDGLSSVRQHINKEYSASENEYFCNVDFKEYFKIFDKLHVAPNWKLESYYYAPGGGGRPVFIAFEKNDIVGDRIYHMLHDSVRTVNPTPVLSNDLAEEIFKYNGSINYLNSIEIADNPMGYFQFVVFALIGDNYCLFWHSNYSELEIITSKEQLLKLTKRKNDFYYKFSKKDKNSPTPTEPNPNELHWSDNTMDIDRVLQIDPSPIVTIGKDAVEVSIVTLGPWEGFISRTYSISKSFPHVLTPIKSDTLIPYHCGIMF